MSDESNYRPATIAVRHGQQRTAEAEHAEPIFATSSYVYESAAQAAARFSGEEPGNIYSRFTNPTVRTFEQRLAAMEGGESCVATASGMSAILSTCMGLLETGDHIVAAREIFGSTVMLFNNYMAKMGISTSYVSLTDTEAWAAAINDRTKMLFLETPSNPMMQVADIQAIADIAHAHDCLLVVDNCFCTPVLQQPLKLGADIVVHSATKYIDGQGRCVGGAVVGDAERVGEQVYGFLRTAGPTMSPLNAWVFLKGLETLPVRMQAHCDAALALAQWLEQQKGVARVYYPGLASHPQHDLAQRQQSHWGAVLAFELAGGKDAAWHLIDQTRLLSITANLGDTRTTITHPATTTHGRLTPEAREEAGISDGMIRIAVGLEDVLDIQADLSRGLG